MVRLEGFSGPLDLLLHLIQRAEVDITHIAIAQITDQFLDHLSAIEHIDVEGAGEFLVVAATLIEIKSRALTPRDELDSSNDGQAEHRQRPMDPAEALVRQLLAFRVYREAARKLTERREQWQHRTPLLPLGIPNVPDPDEADLALDLEDVGLFDLTRSYALLAETVEFTRLGEHTIEQDDTPIEHHAREIIDRLCRLQTPTGNSPSMSFRALFDDRPKMDVIGLFLAILELVRGNRVGIVACDGDVILELRDSSQANAL